MNELLYEMMDWPRIESIVYSEEDQPHDILGPHMTEEGLLIQAFFPGAQSISVKLAKQKKEYEMEMADEAGFFAVLIPRRTIPEYSYTVTYSDGSTAEHMDPYAFDPYITEKDIVKFDAGIHYEIYEKLGAHPLEIKNITGTYFAVWAPNAMRVSVVGDFNNWDGRLYQMRRLGNSGIFELFVPNVKAGSLYKYEIKAMSRLTYLKADPYANAAELRPDTASVVADIRNFNWTDESWLTHRKRRQTFKEPVNIYEVHLGSWRKPEGELQACFNYREIAPLLADYVKDMGYTHIELMPVMEYPFDGSWGYQVTGYYAPTSRYGTPEDFMYFVNYMHEKEIGIILDWVPAHFPRDTFGLSNFDGTCLYEHPDPRLGSHPHWGTLIFNYGKPQVKNFLIANALFWIEKYHVDGIRMDAVASMLYLDYGKTDGEWLPNIYGGNENLEAIEFFKHLNSIVKKREDGAYMIAEESTAWPKVTGEVEDDGLGFDYKWNMGWMNDFIQYMKYDPIARSYHHGELIFSMIYAYSERFILTLSHDEVVHLKGSMLQKMPGKMEKKFPNLRAAYGYMMAHPGKKLLFMGQEFAQLSEWSEERQLNWELLKEEEHSQMQGYVRELNALYKSEPALYELDYNEDGFEWINNISANENILVFARRTGKAEDTLVVVCNFSDVVFDNYKIGVPYAGKYKEIFNSDKVEYGGSGDVNSRVKMSKKEECDDRPNSIRIKVPALGVTFLKYSKAVKKVISNKTAAGGKKDLKDKLTAQVEQEESKSIVGETVKGLASETVIKKDVKEGKNVNAGKTGRGTGKKVSDKSVLEKKNEIDKKVETDKKLAIEKEPEADKKPLDSQKKPEAENKTSAKTSAAENKKSAKTAGQRKRSTGKKKH